MRILNRDIDPKKHSGAVTVCPTDEEDIWYAYNIIKVGDLLRLKTLRKVVHQKDDHAVKTTDRRLVKILVKVLSVQFQADEKGTSLLLKTKNLTESEYVLKGQIQTIEIQLHQPITIIKDCWDPMTVELLEESADVTNNADSIVIMVDDGYAAFFTLKRNFIRLHGKVTRSMPKKKTSLMDKYNEKVESFDANVWRYLFESFTDWKSIKAVILAGPGNARSRLMDKLRDIDQHEKNEVFRTAVRQNIQKFATVGTSSTFKSAISEILKDKLGAKLLADTKALKEVKKLEEFHNTFLKDSNMAVFGEKEVRFAQEQSAIASLLITDGLIRSNNFHIRKRMMALVDQIRATGAEIFIFNESHESGARLRDITGIAALLRFPIDVDSIRDGQEPDEPPQDFDLPEDGESATDFNPDLLGDDAGLLDEDGGL